MQKIIDVVGVFVIFEGKFLILLRQDTKFFPNMWGLPAGKVDSGENLIEAAIREAYEESGIMLHKGEISHISSNDYFYEPHNNRMHLFEYTLKNNPNITLSPKEHKEYKWVTPEEALELPNLMPDFADIIREKFGI